MFQWRVVAFCFAVELIEYFIPLNCLYTFLLVADNRFLVLYKLYSSLLKTLRLHAMFNFFYDTIT